VLLDARLAAVGACGVRVRGTIAVRPVEVRAMCEIGGMNGGLGSGGCRRDINGSRAPLGRRI